MKTLTSSHSWFDDAKFGLFIHWGLYSLRSSIGAEWAIYRESIAHGDYQRYAKRFNPDRFDPDAWVACAKRAGMRYIVFTAKHHDGFCMFHTQTTDWNIANTPFGLDAVAAIAEATRRAGLRFGLYFSIWDLWQPGLDGGLNSIGTEGEFSHDTERTAWKPSPEGIALMHAQLEELMTRYGKIDVLWFDVKRAQGIHYEADRLMRRVRELQPHILINDRLIDETCQEKADIITPENRIPAGGPRDAAGNPLRWEACMCYNQSWGYIHDDTAYKGPGQVLKELIEVTGKGGNLLLNVGPTPRGELPQPWYNDLATRTGAWLDRHHASIFDTRPVRQTIGGSLEWNIFFTNNFRWQCYYTEGKDDTLYLHITRYPGNHRIVLPEFDHIVVTGAWLMADGVEVPVQKGNFLSLHSGEKTLLLPLVPGDADVTTVILETRAK